jgi:hypothetical protein
VAVILLAGIVCSAPKSLKSGHPHVTFNLRAEGDGQIWRISALDENEIGAERLALGDAIAVTGQLDVGVEADRAGRRRVAYRCEAKQILFLRNKSIVRAAAMNGHQPGLQWLATPRG